MKANYSKFYLIGNQPVRHKFLRDGTACIIDGNVYRLLAKETNGRPPGNHPTYRALGPGTDFFTDLDPEGRHDFRSLVPTNILYIN